MYKIFLLTLLLTLGLASLEDSNKLTTYTYQSPTILPRQKAPFFSAMAALPSGKFERISLSDFPGKYVVLLFYPFDFTFVCPTELVAFSDSLDKFKALNSVVLGVSTDSHHTHFAWMKTPRNEGGVGHLQIPLLADISKKMSKAYGVLVEDELDELFGAALRGLFIIDDKGKIRSIQINDVPGIYRNHLNQNIVGRSVDETLRLLEAFQYTDKHGEVCPANWRPGQDTIIPEQGKKQEYFKKQNDQL